MRQRRREQNRYQLYAMNTDCTMELTAPDTPRNGVVERELRYFQLRANEMLIVAEFHGEEN
jgi:hypothetical protein